MRVAVLPHPWDTDSEDTLIRHAYAYPRGGKVAFDIDGDGDQVEMRWVGWDQVLLGWMSGLIDLIATPRRPAER